MMMVKNYDDLTIRYGDIDILVNKDRPFEGGRRIITQPPSLSSNDANGIR